MKSMAFDTTFKSLTGNEPFPWQWELYRRFAAGEIPSSCNLPTGLGKTSVIAIWLIALANHPDKMPRRLVYVVNRRTVVDQTTNEVEKVRANIKVTDLTQRLRDLCALPLDKPSRGNAPEEDPPLSISTLRGQFADNRQWSADPCRPAVICGTVDMIGSRLLFGGYVSGFKTKPLHAGFFGQDALIVHDEAHLEPAFQKLIEAIRDEQRNEPAPLGEAMRMRVMALTATSRDGADAFGLQQDDYVNETVRRRMNARKVLTLIPIDDEKKLAEKIVELAKAHESSSAAVVIFVRKVEDVEKIAAKLPGKRTVQLTGTLRGKERDDLVQSPIFQRFLPNAQPGAETVYLVCTSAGEVGVNISAHHLACDLATFESVAQRLGRVNRFGTVAAARVDLVFPKSFGKEGNVNDLDQRRQKTLALLERLNGDASPKALGDLPLQDRIAAFSPQPTILPVSDILFDSWALTTIRGKLPGRPPLDPYLHGVSEWEPPETHVAWRLEVEVITEQLLDSYPPQELLEDYPLKPHELLRDRSDRVFKHLAMLALRHPDHSVWLLDDDGSVKVLNLRDLAGKADKDRINGRTVVLAPSTGGLRDGLLDGAAKAAEGLDVADDWLDENRQQKRARCWDGQPAPPNMRLIRSRIDIKPEADDLHKEKVPGKRFWRWYELPAAAESDGSKTAREPVKWLHHTQDVTDNADKIAQKSVLPEQWRELLHLAAEFHDLGKRRELWQRSIGHRLPRNPQPEDWLAKSGGAMAPVEITKYRHEFGSLRETIAFASPPPSAGSPDRHEFGSLRETIAHDAFRKLTMEAQDIILHLIAAHHGRARPHFPEDEAFDPNSKEADAAAIAAEVPRRFARLQRRFGRWGLAYLESLLRAADYAASAKPSKREDKQ
jgi:CRISPR-associated endonuclease/helicase Cas3